MHFARKRFGQHFLTDENVIHHIIDVLAPKKDEHLVEIGPGQGALTFPVLASLHHLEAIELDRDLIAELHQRTKEGLVIYAADALKFDFAVLKQDQRLLRLFGNLPYNISTPLLFHLLSFATSIKNMLFMLQKEVAERLAAPVASDAYGRLSVMVQYHCHVECLFDVPNHAFNPPPKVTSSIVRLTPYQTKPALAQDYASFAEIVREAFGQRRKTLRNSLKKLIDDTTWEKLPIRSDLRAENLSVADFVTLSNTLKVS
jgi:16S rRNA (adenine1518-N6/adenine1519-N6)-dimethyltransferase